MELIPCTTEFADIFWSWRQEPATRAFNPLKAMTPEQAREHLGNCTSDLSELKEATDYRWFVREGGEVVGIVSLKSVSATMATGEIGYSLGEKYRGRGLGTAAVRLLVDKLFAETALRKLTAYVHSENVASCRLLERLGFRREGLLREHYMVEGHAVDEALYGLLRREWARA